MKTSDLEPSIARASFSHPGNSVVSPSRMSPRITFALASTVVLALACGSTQKPPPVEEVPIDKSGTTTGGNGNDPSSGGGGGTTTGGGGGGTTTGGGGTGGNGGGPTPLTTDDGKPDAGTAPAPSATTTGPTHAGGLTAKECDTVINKFLQMMSTENHIPLPDLNGQTGQLGEALSGMKGECSQKTTKKQYTCAMASKNTAGWKKCME